MTRKERIKREFNEYLFGMDIEGGLVDTIDTFVQEEVEQAQRDHIDLGIESTSVREHSLREALEKIAKYKDSPEYIQRGTLLDIVEELIKIAQQALKGNEPDPSYSQLVKLVKEAWQQTQWFGDMSEGHYERLKKCIEKLEGE